ncbi:kyphoscoliosis peptidase-like [Pelodytes ibericus]
MALHHQLKPWQRILLGIFCFPILPFYLCVYCLCLKEEVKENDLEEGRQDTNQVGDTQSIPKAKSRPFSSSNRVHTEKVNTGSQKRKQREEACVQTINLEENVCIVPKDNNTKVAATNKGFQYDEDGTKRKDVHTEKVNTGSQKRKQREEACVQTINLEENVCIVPKDNNTKVAATNKGFQLDEDGTKRKDVHTEKVNTGSQKRKQREEACVQTINLEENVCIVPKDNNTKVAATNKGFQLDEDGTKRKDVNRSNDDHQERKKRKDSHSTIFTYPWDKSNLKSIQLDLKGFENLDSYASKVDSNGSLENLVKDLIREAATDLQKARVLWIWICHHIEYDTIGLKNIALTSIDPDEILRTRRGVCAGYSSLFQRMCSIAGVTCKTVNGHAKGSGYKVGQKISGDSNHAWNMVYVEGSWHLLDSTWGAGQVKDSTNKFTYCYNEFYFLTHPALFIEQHLPDDPKWQLLQPLLSLKHFEQMVPHQSHFYKKGLLSSQPDTAIIKTVKGKVSITIESCRHILFLFHLNKTEKPGVMRLMEYGLSLDVYPQRTGKHVLQIFAKETDAEGHYDWVLEYLVDCNSVDTTMKIPKCLNDHAGPSWLTEKAGLFQPSHPDPVITTPDGCCTLSFTLKGITNLFCTLDSDDVPMTSDMKRRHILQSQKEDKVEFNVRLPQSGTYVLCVNVKDKSSDVYNSQCNYLIICSNPTVHWPVFPIQYKSWAKHYDLVKPLNGILPKNSTVSFKLLVPGVGGLSVEGEKSFNLALSEEGYWEGTCNTSDSKEIFVTVIYKEKPNTRIFILQYLVQ